MGLLKVDSIVDSTGASSPVFPNGLATFNPITDKGDSDVTLTTTDAFQITSTPTANRNINLPGLGLKAGATYKIYNKTAASSPWRLMVNVEGGGNLVANVPPAGERTFIALIDDPALPADWRAESEDASPLFTSSALQIHSGDSLVVDTSGGALNITLPASPNVGDQIELYDAVGTWGTNPVTLLRNGNNILGAGSDFTLDIDGSSVKLIYISVAQGWRIY